MKKYLFGIVFLVLALIAFSGTVAAEATVDSYYVDDQGNEIDEAEVGDDIEYLAWVENDENPVTDASLNIEINSNVQWENTEYYASYDDGETWNPTTVNRVDNTLIWDIGPIAADQVVALNIHGTMASAGEEVLTATAYDGERAMGSDEASITVTEPTPTPTPTPEAVAAGTSETVGMQTTGSPVSILLLAFGLITAGLAYSKKY